jgi:PIN domain nuclease of toxin-antitoxin system
MIILDTHILLWWTSDPEKLSSKAQSAIKLAFKQNQIAVSAITIWEIYLLVKKGRLKLTLDVDSWMSKIEQLPIQFIPIDNDIAKKSVQLSDSLHDDPADRMIIATTLQAGGRLVTSDQKILEYPHVRTIW